VFVVLPAAVLVLVFADLVWEVVRSNVAIGAKPGWPWRFSVLGVATAASIVGVLGGLILAREQFARSVRPALTWGGNSTATSELLHGQCWSIRLFNGGAGHCIVQSVSYRFNAKGAQAQPDDWLDRAGTMSRLQKLPLLESSHFKLEMLGQGAALAPVTKASDGIEIVAFDRYAVDTLASFTVRVRITDMVGDQYQRDIDCLRGVETWT